MTNKKRLFAVVACLFLALGTVVHAQPKTDLLEQQQSKMSAEIESSKQVADSLEQVEDTQEQKQRAGSQEQKQTNEPKVFVESEQIVETSKLWQDDGLRVDLGYFENTIYGLSGSPDGLIKGAHIGLGTRLDHQWSLAGTLRYGVGSEGLSGLNFSGLLSTLFHWYGLGIGLGIGVIGVEERVSARADLHQRLASEIVASYTEANNQRLLSRCVGFGPMAAFTTLYRIPITTVFGLKLGAQIDLARLTCEQTTDRVEPDTAEAIVIRQYWDRWSWSFFGGLTWR